MSTEERLTRLGLAHLINLPEAERRKELRKYLKSKEIEAKIRDQAWKDSHPEWEEDNEKMKELAKKRITKAKSE